MTLETRYLAALTDILGLQITCGRCQTRVACSLEEAQDFPPVRCPNCGEVFVSHEDVTGRKALADLRHAIRTLRADPTRFRLHLDLGP